MEGSFRNSDRITVPATEWMLFCPSRKHVWCVTKIQAYVYIPILETRLTHLLEPLNVTKWHTINVQG